MMSITQLRSLDNFKSLFDFQYFVCPLCPFKWRSKQGFIDHVWQKHPVLVEKMKNLQDDSMDGVILPWNQMNSNGDLTGKNNIQEEEIKTTIMEIKDESLDAGDTRKVVSDDKNSEELKCNDCGKLFTSKDSLKIHRSLNCEHMNSKKNVSPPVKTKSDNVISHKNSTPTKKSTSSSRRACAPKRQLAGVVILWKGKKSSGRKYF